MTTIYTVNNKVLKNSANDKWLKKYVDPYNPLGLPANTIRVKFTSGYTPSMGDTQTLVDSNENIWDIYKESNNWSALFVENINVIEFLGANTTNVTNMSWMFGYCNITYIPLFDTSSVTNMSGIFASCVYVEIGALALYQQASTQVNPPSSYQNAFNNCGRDTVTGAAELAQIPSSWGGTGA